LKLQTSKWIRLGKESGGGEIVRFNTRLDSGETLNVRNDPELMVWKKPKWMAGKLSPPPATVSNTWIIFADGKPPYQLSTCTRSFPINWQDASLAADLDKLTRNAHR
jgi:hypothetical protein